MTPMTQHTKSTVHTQVFCPLCLESWKKSPPAGSELLYNSGVSWWPQRLSRPWCCHWQNVLCLPQGYTVYSFLLFPCKSVPDGKRSCTPQRRDQTPSGYGTTGVGSTAWFRMGRQQGVLKSFCEQSKNLSIAMKCSLLRISNHRKSQLGLLEFLATFVWKGCEPLQSWPEFQAGNETNFPWFHYRNVSHL